MLLPLAALLGACDPQGTPLAAVAGSKVQLTDHDKQLMALAPPDVVPAGLEPQVVTNDTGLPRGDILIDTNLHRLFFVMGGGKAIEYAIASGRDEAKWTGTTFIKRKVEWPTWMPPGDMMKRWPEFAVYKKHGPLQGQWDNPLGARAMYLYWPNGQDSLYRIHGTNEPDLIGQGVSSGCIRMRDADAIDLYSRVKIGAKVVVR
ncbi:MAG: L,D-transpeptidase [Hyphomicrobiales bacterium]|nr:L,D-transpeptidase [Hyphomicrobiales bacterium]MDE2018609.1 L,D-transpeptidase [Hyphomicrobiales bacterium]